MDWLSKHKVLIDCAKKFVKLITPGGKEMEFVTEPVVTAKGVANHVKVNQIDGGRLCCHLTETSRLPSRTSTHFLALMIYLINSVVHVCSQRSIFDRDIIS
jgi:hypothetical protein